jgi:hypothetical protein
MDLDCNMPGLHVVGTIRDYESASTRFESSQSRNRRPLFDSSVNLSSCSADARRSETLVRKAADLNSLDASFSSLRYRPGPKPCPRFPRRPSPPSSAVARMPRGVRRIGLAVHRNPWGTRARRTRPPLPCSIGPNALSVESVGFSFLRRVSEYGHMILGCTPLIPDEDANFSSNRIHRHPPLVHATLLAGWPENAQNQQLPPQGSQIHTASYGFR